MAIFRRKIPAICFLIVISFFIHGPVHGYVLQGLHILDLMIEQLGEAQGLFVTQDLIFYRLVSRVDSESGDAVADISSVGPY